MIKISFLICGTCLIGWIIFVGVMSAIVSHPSPERVGIIWGIISGITAGIAIASFALSYLGGHIIRGNSGAIRLGVLISVLWVAVSFVALEPYSGSYWGQSWTEFFGIRIIPVISYWGYPLGYFWIFTQQKQSGKFIIVT